MKIRTLVIVVAGCLLLIFSGVAADSGGGPAPAVIEQGFQAWAKNRNGSYAMDVWKKGGLLEYDRKPVSLANYFRQMDGTIGNYKSYEVISVKPVGESSQIIYAAIRFERVAVYGRFLMYHADKGWVVQNMDFSTKPEAVMPWLAFSEVNYSDGN